MIPAKPHREVAIVRRANVRPLRVESLESRALLTAATLAVPTPAPFAHLDVPGLTAAGVTAIAGGDYDNDGRMDLLVAGRDAHLRPFSRLYHNDGQNRFHDVQAELIGAEAGSLAWGDYDGDGLPDILITGHRIGTQVYHNDGNGRFHRINAGIDGGENGESAWGDYDGDGRLDVLVTGFPAAGGNPIARIYHNDGNGRFHDIDANLPGVQFGSASWGDYDGDGRLDILLTGMDAITANPSTYVYHNDGGGRFHNIQAGLTGVQDGAAAWGDYDGDGQLDVLVAGWSGQGQAIAKVYHNDGNNTFHDIAAGLMGVEMSSVAWGDYDGDGCPDILLGGSTPTWNSISKIYHNDGNGRFHDIAAPLRGIHAGAAIWGDVDGDRRLDVLLAGFGTTGAGDVEVYRNTSQYPTGPNVTIIGPEDGYHGVAGQARTFTFHAKQSGGIRGPLTYRIDWGDGTQVQTVTGSTPLAVNHVFPLGRRYTVTAMASDEDGIRGPTSVALPVQILVAEQQGPNVLVGGTRQSDQILLTRGTAAGAFSIQIGNQFYGDFTVAAGGSAKIFGQGANDAVFVRGTIGDDRFLLARSGVSVNGSWIEGDDIAIWRLNGRDGADSLDLSAIADAVAVNLQPATVRLRKPKATTLATFVGFGTLIGNNLPSTVLIGPNLTTTWVIDGANTGTVNDVRFVQFKYILGGKGTDRFEVAGVPGFAEALAGRIDGGGGLNVLDYSWYPTVDGAGVTVNLGVGTATGVGSVANIRFVVGSRGSDALSSGNRGNILLGGAGNDALQGGGGRDVVLGGSGNDTLRGGRASDILFGGTVTYYDEATHALNLDALNAIFATWGQCVSYSRRIKLLTTRSTATLVSSTTFVDDAGAVDHLFGRKGVDWIIAGPGDVVHDAKKPGTGADWGLRSHADPA